MLKTASSTINALGALVYQGTWDASANNPTLTSSVGTKGNYYVVSVAGTTTLNGISSWSVGDWAVFNGSVWQKVDGGTSESFVNLTVTGTANIATGNVVNMTSSNVTITGGTENAVTYTNVTISSGNVTVTNDNVAYSNISTALRTQSLTGYLYGNANTGNVSAATTIPVASVTGAVPNTVNVLAGTGLTGGGALTANVTISDATSGVTAASYGNASTVATFTVAATGKITSASNTAIAISNTQVSGLGTMSTQNSNSVSITGGNVTVSGLRQLAQSNSTTGVTLLDASLAVVSANDTLIGASSSTSYLLATITQNTTYRETAFWLQAFSSGDGGGLRTFLRAEGSMGASSTQTTVNSTWGYEYYNPNSQLSVSVYKNTTNGTIQIWLNVGTYGSAQIFVTFSYMTGSSAATVTWYGMQYPNPSSTGLTSVSAAFSNTI